MSAAAAILLAPHLKALATSSCRGPSVSPLCGLSSTSGEGGTLEAGSGLALSAPLKGEAGAASDIGGGASK